MTHVFQFVIAIMALTFFAWLLLSSKNADQDVEFDPNDSTEIGMLIGMTGGSVEDAAVARSALCRFDEQNGRRATMRDAATVVGIMRSLR